MISGLLAGLLWGFDTVIIGIALSMTPFSDVGTSMVLAPFVSTFLHDLISSLWMFIYLGLKKQLRQVYKALRSKSGKYIILGALFGGPIGMSGYVASIYFIGPSYTAIISSLFPAVGAFLAYLFLKEKMKWYQLLGLAVSIFCVILLGYSASGQEVNNLAIGMICALICVFGWSLEAVICAYGMKDPDIKDEYALHIRQCTSALFYGIVIINVIGGWSMSFSTLGQPVIGYVIISALFGTASYVFYYKAIHTIGSSKAMALNITYNAWTVVLAFALLGTMPEAKSIILGLFIILGSLCAAIDFRLFLKKDSI